MFCLGSSPIVPLSCARRELKLGTTSSAITNEVVISGKPTRSSTTYVRRSNSAPLDKYHGEAGTSKVDRSHRSDSDAPNGIGAVKGADTIRVEDYSDIAPNVDIDSTTDSNSTQEVDGGSSGGDMTATDTAETTKQAHQSGKTPTEDIAARQQKNNSNATTQTKPPRRSIFSQYRRKREDSLYSTDESSTCSSQRKPCDILEFSPPLDHRHRLQKHFSMPEKFPMKKAQELPPLPTPLLRYTTEGVEGKGGWYPILQPKSILRQGKFSQRSTSSLSSGDEESNTDGNNENARPVDIDWNTKQEQSCSNGDAPPRLQRRLSEFERIARNMNLEEAKQFFRETGSTTPDRETLVKFDPRIVITEFPDDVERAWFTDEDLDRFKRETIMLVKHYMLLHPELAEELNARTIDPVTGKVRKKALYALPGLCSAAADVEDSFGSADEIERLLKNAVRRILIVDPNKSILQLFEKSIRNMFPDANITLVQSGEEALRIYSAELERQKRSWDGHNHGYDIVIVEEQLNRRGLKSGRKRYVHKSARMVRRMNSDTAYPASSSSSALRTLTSPSMPKPDSLYNLQSFPSPGRDTRMTGSQLIEQICLVENEFYKVPETTEEEEVESADEASSSVFSPPQRWSLIIGVSMNAERDKQQLEESGADLVWGKPPPTMNEELRNKLISALIAKRQKASFCVKL